MAIFNRFCTICFCLLLCNACSNDFVLTEPPSDVAIVYGILAAKDTANYIRVERAFIDEETSALVLSKDINELYFANARVTLTNVAKNKTYDLVRVDGNKEGYKRDPGIFADAPNYLYKLPKSVHDPIENDIYKISVFSGEKLVTDGTTRILKSYKDNDLTPSATSNLAFVYAFNTNFSWFGDDNAVLHDLTLVFNYREEKNGIFTNKSVSWPIVKNHTKLDPGAPSNIYGTPGLRFYSFLRGAIDVDPLVKRYFRDADLILTSGGKEILDYVSIGQANLGITSSGEIPVFSNLTKDGLGIFSSKTKLERKKMSLAQPTLDSLRLGIYTKALNFQ